MPLNSMDFPLDIKVCFQPLRFNETVLKSFGYANTYEYIDGFINGLSNHNDSHVLVGWGGNHSVQIKDASKILHAAKYDWTTSKVLKNFSIWPQPGWEKPKCYSSEDELGQPLLPCEHGYD